MFLAEDDADDVKPPLKKAKTDDKKTDSKTNDDDVIATSFQAGSEWAGVCTYPENNDHYPFELEVLKVDGPKVEVWHAREV